ncbi:MAG TPA: ferric reductase-like transmembrane domain-containing protein [Rhizomicrobium sp.]|nr:ferric reductase-like transmembrane domain-containing protein [Rhizomicrobium sp.]
MSAMNQPDVMLERRRGAAAPPSAPSFTGDLRLAAVDATVAVILSGIVFAVLMARLRAGVDTAAIEMPEMVKNGGVWAYSVSQAVGWGALAWSWLTILLGVSLPIVSAQRRPALRRTLERVHRSTSLTVVGLMFAHAFVLDWDGMGDTLLTDFVPYTTSYTPGLFAEALGIVSFYVAVLLGLSFYLRDRIGLKTWRLLHRYVIPAVYILAVWHTFIYGSDVMAHRSLRLALWVVQLPILAAFAMRLRLPFAVRDRRKS